NGIIEQYAAHLEAKATRVVIRLTMCFGLVGAVLGGFPRFYTHNALVPAHLGYATLLLGAVAGAYLGYTFGERRALDHRMQARLAGSRTAPARRAAAGAAAQLRRLTHPRGDAGVAVPEQRSHTRDRCAPPRGAHLFPLCERASGCSSASTASATRAAIRAASS